MMSIIIIALLVNLLIETTESFTVVVPRGQTVARVGSTVTLPCWISPPENAEVLEIRWYRQDQFSKPVLFYQQGKIIQEESYRNRSSLTLRSDQSGGLKDGDVSLRLEKLTVHDEDSFHCYVSGESVYDSGEVVLKVIDSPDSSDLWKALFFTLLICAVLGLFGLILYKYRQKNTICCAGKKPDEQICEDGALKELTEEAVGEINIEELRKHAVKITIDQHYVSSNLIIKDRKIMNHSNAYKHTGEGFPYQLCAYGAQKFTSGRHYWEVALAQVNKPPKKYWLIGVAKHANVRVKDRSALTPSNGYWFLCSDGPNGVYTSSDPPVSLPLTPRPEQLGVLLDYDLGQLSFYNVKERKHVLTMSTTFTGAVSPLFNPGVKDKSPLIILDCPEPVETPVESSEPLLKNTGSKPDARASVQHIKTKNKPL